MKAQRMRARTLAIAIALGFGLALPLGVAWGHRAPIAPPAAGMPAVDARLIVRPHAVRLGITLPRGIRLEGTLAPAIPGPNNIHLVVQPGVIVGAHLELEATMPGMAMAPARAMLTARGDDYRGVLTLPMFGRYRLRVTLSGRGTRPMGAMNLDLLPPSAGIPSAATQGQGNGQG